MNKTKDYVTLIVETTTAVPHFQTSLEILLNRLSRGQQVLYLPLYKSYSYQEFGNTISKNIAAAADIILRQSKNSKLTYIDINTNVDGKLLEHVPLVLPNDFKHLSEYKFLGFNLGRAIIASCCVHLKGIPIDDGHYFTDGLVREVVASAWRSLVHLMAVLDRYHCNEVIVFNGRFATNYLVAVASMAKEKEVYIHERGSNLYRYTLNKFPDTIKATVNRILYTPSPHSEETIGNLASLFYLRQRYNSKDTWNESREFPDFDSDTPSPFDFEFDVFFHSNLDEFFSLPEETLDIGFGQQLDAIKALADLLASEGRTLVLRLHPIMAHRATFLKDVSNVFSSSKNIIVIAPDAEANSYQLAMHARNVFHVGSTIGQECVFARKPSICLGYSVFSELYPRLSPKNIIELKHLISQPLQLTDDEWYRSLLFGASSFEVGLPYFFYKPTTLFDGTINLELWLKRLEKH